MSDSTPETSSKMGSTLVDEYAMAILNGFCSNPALQGAVSEQELVAKSFEMAREAMRLRLPATEEIEAEIFFLMDAGRYVASVSRLSRTVTYTRSEREAVIYFDSARADNDGEFCRAEGHQADLRRGRALVSANGKLIPLPVTDWREQMIAEGKTPPEEPAAGS